MTPVRFGAARREFSRLLLEFDNPETERAYIAMHNARAVGPLRLAIAFMAISIVIPLAGEYYGFMVEGWTGFDAYLSLLPYRIAGLAILAAAWALTRLGWAQRNGQALVILFVAALTVMHFSTVEYFTDWVERASALFNLGLTLLIVASGLLFRHAAPLAALACIGWVLALGKWMDNAFAPAWVTIATTTAMIAIAYFRERAERLAWAAGLSLAEEKKVSEELLLNVLPPSIADRMRGGETLIADRHEGVAVVFADIVNFTPLSASMPAQELVAILDDIFTRFDGIAAALDLEKIKTIGDAYMMAAGLPRERAPDPGLALEAALRMREALAEVARSRGIDIDMRAGVHVGEVVAGVIGRSKFVYDLWGDVVNVASRMESTAPKGAIQVTEEIRDAMDGRFAFEPRGEIDVKGKGRMTVWVLTGRKARA